MSKFDELKKAAELAMQSASDFEYEQFQCTYGPAKFLELLAIQAQLVAALSKSKRYVSGAYECAFPDEEENAQVLIDIDAALAAAGEQP